jgi:restriction endonuclease
MVIIMAKMETGTSKVYVYGADGNLLSRKYKIPILYTS